MAGVDVIQTVLESLSTYLTRAYQATSLNTRYPFTFGTISSSELAPQETSPDEVTDHRVTLYLYGITVNPHVRHTGHPRDPHRQPPPLALDLHLLFSVWTASAAAEHLAIAWLMRELHLRPFLDASLLGGTAGWPADETIQVIPSELSTEDMMRIWDALTPSYRLSVSYVARVARIDPDPTPADAQPVVARRLAFTETTPAA